MAERIILDAEVSDSDAKKRKDLLKTCCLLPTLSQCSLQSHMLHLRYQNQGDTPKGPLKLVWTLRGVLTHNLPVLGDQKNEDHLFFMIIFLMRKMYFLERSLSPVHQIRFAFRKGLFSHCVNAEPRARVFFACIIQENEGMNVSFFYYLKSQSFSLCKFSRLNPRCSIPF